MSDDRENDSRPAKRARLDESAAHTPSTPAATSQAAPGSILNAPSQIETDHEREVRAGIAEYICPDNLGFTGTLKQRYTDFLVNEIGLDGQVLHLKSTQVEKKKKKEKKEDDKAEAPVEQVNEEKIELREEKEDAQNGGNVAPAAANEDEKPVEAEPVAKKEEAIDGEETFTIGGAPKKEDKEEVCNNRSRVLDSVLTIYSYPTRIPNCSTRSSAKKRQHKS
jgi:tRNA pseudouridine13 synthase